MAFPMPHPICPNGSPNDSCDSPEQKALDKTYERYLNSFPPAIAKRISEKYRSYDTSRNIISDQQIADDMTAYVDSLTRSHRAKEAALKADEDREKQAQEIKTAKAAQRETIFARAATLAPDATPLFVGKAIKEARQEADMSQGELAAILGVTVGAVSHYEIGLTAVPPERLTKLAQLFGKTVEEFTAHKP